MIYTLENTPKNVVVLLDGKKIERVVYADTAMGFLTYYNIPVNGSVATAYGKVEVLVPIHKEIEIELTEHQKDIVRVIEGFKTQEYFRGYISSSNEISEYHTITLSMPRRSGKTTIANYLHGKYKSELFYGGNQPNINKHPGARYQINMFIFDDITYSIDIINDYVTKMRQYNLVTRDFKVVILETRCR